MAEQHSWVSTTPVYNTRRDTIDLIADDGEILARLSRNTVIRMLELLPSEPPKALAT